MWLVAAGERRPAPVIAATAVAVTLAAAIVQGVSHGAARNPKTRAALFEKVVVPQRLLARSRARWNAVAVRRMCGQAAGPCELVQQRSMGLDDAATVRALWRRQRALDGVLEDEDAIEAVKAEALRELSAAE